MRATLLSLLLLLLDAGGAGAQTTRVEVRKTGRHSYEITTAPAPASDDPDRFAFGLVERPSADPWEIDPDKACPIEKAAVEATPCRQASPAARCRGQSAAAASAAGQAQAARETFEALRSVRGQPQAALDKALARYESSAATARAAKGAADLCMVEAAKAISTEIDQCREEAEADRARRQAEADAQAADRSSECRVKLADRLKARARAARTRTAAEISRIPEEQRLPEEKARLAKLQPKPRARRAPAAAP